MYNFCSCDATMIPDVDHHQYFSLEPMASALQTNFPAYMDGVFPFLTFICLYLRASICSGFLFWIILMSERISGRHALRHVSNKTTHMTSRSSLCWFPFRPGLHFLGDTELRARHLPFTRCFTRGAGTPPSLLSAFVRLEICAVLNLRFLASQKSERTV